MIHTRLTDGAFIAKLAFQPCMAWHNGEMEMKSYRGGIIGGNVLVAGALFAILGIIGIVIIPERTTPLAEMRIEPKQGIELLNKTFTVDIVAESSVPVNVFAGDIHFDPSMIAVASIDYNTSIADLWAELPWYSNGEGTLNFAGGTTRKGGFMGSGSIITITFQTLKEGGATIALNDARILLHDGTGNDAPLRDVVNATYQIQGESQTAPNLIAEQVMPVTYAIVANSPSPDLNGDGSVTIADNSIFFIHLLRNNPRSDFNGDGRVDTKDLSILLGAR